MRNRSRSAVILASVVALGAPLLAGCTSTPATSAECSPRVGTGALSQHVTVLGGFGIDPEGAVTIPKDFSVGAAQVQRIDSSQERAPLGDSDAVVSVNYALFESETGSVIERSDSFSAERGNDFVPYTRSESRGAFLDALDCAAPGDRLIVVFPEEEAAPIASSLGLSPETNIVGLIDVLSIVPNQLQGRARDLPGGFPGVVNNAAGQPGVVTVPGKAPEELKSAVRIASDGLQILDSDKVVGNVLQVSWEGDLLSNSWATGGPQFLGSTDSAQSAVRPYLTGARVGSQMVYLVPNAAGSSDIFVVDILAAG